MQNKITFTDFKPGILTAACRIFFFYWDCDHALVVEKLECFYEIKNDTVWWVILRGKVKAGFIQEIGMLSHSIQSHGAEISSLRDNSRLA